MSRHKIGTHLIKCLHDVLEQRVSTDEIIVIFSDTNCTDVNDFLDHIETQWRQMSLSTEPIRYDYDISQFDADHVVSVSSDLWHMGLIHQPRMYGHHYNAPVYWIGRKTWISAIPEPEYNDPSNVINAYETFAILRNLSK